MIAAPVAAPPQLSAFCCSNKNEKTPAASIDQRSENLASDMGHPRVLSPRPASGTPQHIPDWDYCLVCSLRGTGTGEPKEHEEPGQARNPRSSPLARRLLLYAVISLEESVAEAFAWQTAYYH